MLTLKATGRWKLFNDRKGNEEDVIDMGGPKEAVENFEKFELILNLQFTLIIEEMQMLKSAIHSFFLRRDAGRSN